MVYLIALIPIYCTAFPISRILCFLFFKSLHQSWQLPELAIGFVHFILRQLILHLVVHFFPYLRISEGIFYTVVVE